MKLEEILIKLKTEKLCPSHFGLEDYYGLECVGGDYIVDCNHCREMSVKNNMKIKVDKECPGDGNIRCIDCSCHLCDNDCEECNVENCEPREVRYK